MTSKIRGFIMEKEVSTLENAVIQQESQDIKRLILFIQ